MAHPYALHLIHVARAALVFVLRDALARDTLTPETRAQVARLLAKLERSPS